ncbi:MAG: hypothetical protein QOD60_2583 [Solirubrobacterales bacterium]|nr:hypothetical protein [Solirubrobacterales bacterium]
MATEERRARWKLAGSLACFVALTCVGALATPASGGPGTPRTLTVTLAGTGSGSVSDGTYINCPGACSHSYLFGTMVTLTGTPAAGSTFSGWSGGGCAGTGACTVAMTSDQAITASFTAIPPTGERAAALEKCRHKHSKKKRRKCRRRANLLPV